MRGVIIVLISLCAHAALYAQEDSIVKQTRLSVQLSGLQTSFQDVKYSNTRYNGLGGQFSIAREKEKPKYILETRLDVSYSNQVASTFDPNFLDWGKTLVLTPTLNVKYKRKLENDVTMGARLDLVDFYFRKVSGLGNNGTYYNNSINLYYSISKMKELKSKTFYGVLDLGLISWNKESTSFAFSAPQSTLEDGKFNYQDKGVNSIYGLSYFDISPIWKTLNIATRLGVNVSKRWSFEYSWNMRHSSVIKGYPTTRSYHALGAKFRITNKTKTSQQQEQIDPIPQR